MRLILASEMGATPLNRRLFEHSQSTYLRVCDVAFERYRMLMWLHIIKTILAVYIPRGWHYQELIIVERRVSNTIQGLYKWFSVIQRDSLKPVNKHILAEEKNVMTAHWQMWWFHPGRTKKCDEESNLHIWNILQFTKFYRGSPLNHAESFVEALYCVRHSPLHYY